MSHLYKVDIQSKDAEPMKEAEFSQLGLKERYDIQKWVGRNPGILGEDLLIVAEEFADFDRTKERLDLLAVDPTGDLVVIELKRDDSGTHVHGQAIKYASYLDRATPEEIVRLLANYKKTSEEEAAASLKSHIGTDDLETLNSQQRIILASHRFAPEVTSAVLWLNDRFHRPLITCVRLTPHVDPETEALYLQSSTIIPVPGKRQYRIQTSASGDSGLAEEPIRTNPHHREIRGTLDRVQELIRSGLEDHLVPSQAYRPTQWGYWLYWYDQQPWGKWNLCYMIQLVNLASVAKDRWKLLLARGDAVPTGANANWAAEIAVLWKATQEGPPESVRRRIGEMQIHPDQDRMEHKKWRKLLLRLHTKELDEEFTGQIGDLFRSFIDQVTPAVNQVFEEDAATS